MLALIAALIASCIVIFAEWLTNVAAVFHKNWVSLVVVFTIKIGRAHV